MKRSMCVTVGFKQTALRSASFDKTVLLAEADAFRYAVGMMLNSIVPLDFKVNITDYNNGFHVDIIVPNNVEADWVAQARNQDSTLSEDDAKQNLFDLLGSYLNHIDDMVNNYGIHCGDSLMLVVN